VNSGVLRLDLTTTSARHRVANAGHPLSEIIADNLGADSLHSQLMQPCKEANCHPGSEMAVIRPLTGMNKRQTT
jgi:hypothetical protein